MWRIRWGLIEQIQCFRLQSSSLCAQLIPVANHLGSNFSCIALSDETPAPRASMGQTLAQCYLPPVQPTFAAPLQPNQSTHAHPSPSPPLPERWEVDTCPITSDHWWDYPSPYRCWECRAIWQRLLDHERNPAR